MTGHIRERGNGRWQILFDIAPDPVTGRRRQRSRTITGTRADAEAELERILDELDAGTWADDGTIRLGAFVDMWLEARRHQIEDTTWHGYRQKLGYLTRAMGHRRLAQVTGGSLAALYSRLQDDGLGASSVHQLHRITKRLFSDAVRWGYLRANPVERADPPKVIRPEMEVWSAADLSAFLDAARDDPYWAAWLVAAMTGMRRGEVAGLRWRSVSLDDATLEVRTVHKSIGGRLVVAEHPKTSTSRRRITLDSATVTELAVIRGARTVAALDGSDPVVTSPRRSGPDDPGLVNPDVLSKSFVRLVGRLGLPPISLHGLRHTHATLLMAAGESPKVVQERLGHARASMTIDIYTHTAGEQHRAAADRFAGLLRRA